MPRLVVREGPNRGTSFALSGDRLTIGRDNSSDIQLPDKRLSRHHAELRKDGEFYNIVDLGSRNGTSISGRRIKEHRLSGGEQISLGSTRLEFVNDPASASQLNLDEAIQDVDPGAFETLSGDEAPFVRPANTTDAEPLARANEQLVALVSLSNTTSGISAERFGSVRMR